VSRRHVAQPERSHVNRCRAIRDSNRNRRRSGRAPGSPRARRRCPFCNATGRGNREGP
jgi:hypothetical protein